MIGRISAMLLIMAAAASARTGVGDPIHVFRERPVSDGNIDFVLHGHLRLRSALTAGADLRLIEPTTKTGIFPTNGTYPTHGHDFRLRLTPSLFLGDDVRVFADVDLLQVGYGVMATGVTRPADGLHVGFTIRAIGLDWVLPIGTLSIGRMTSAFAMGIGTNSGADVDDDGGDIADRVSFVAPVAGHLLAVALDVGPGLSSSPFGPTSRALLVGEQAISFGMLNWTAPWEIELLRSQGRHVLNYGAAVALEWSSKDVPGLWPRLGDAAASISNGALQYNDVPVRRDSRVLVGDVWLRWTNRFVDAQGEVWLADLHIDNPSPWRGIEVRTPMQGNPWAAALRLRSPVVGPWLQVQFDAVVASPDQAAGVANANPTAFARAVSGDVFGPQINFNGGDFRIDSGRAHPLHRIDLILWRTLLGGVSEAAVVRMAVDGSIDLDDSQDPTAAKLRWSGGAVYSHALSSSMPGGGGPMGVELDAQLSAQLPFAPSCSARLEAGLLLPMAALVPAGVTWRPATMMMLRMAYEL
jgi:hypothetical protein